MFSTEVLRSRIVTEQVLDYVTNALTGDLKKTKQQKKNPTLLTGPETSVRLDIIASLMTGSSWSCFQPQGGVHH